MARSFGRGQNKDVTDIRGLVGRTKGLAQPKGELLIHGESTRICTNLERYKNENLMFPLMMAIPAAKGRMEKS